MGRPGSAGARRPLTRQRILRAAVRLVDEGGVEALSMRTLAARLGVGTMSLYNHISGKEALLDGIVGTVLSEIEVEPFDREDWASTVRAILRAFREVARRHPNVVPLIAMRPPATPEALRPVERGFDALRRAGLDEATTAHVYRLVAAWVIGFVSLESGGFFRQSDAGVQGADLTPEALMRFPRILESAPHLLDWDPDAEFETGLDLILSSLRATVRPAGTAPAPAAR